MQNFMKTIINAVQAWTKKEISKIPTVEPDWNENDPNKYSYIKNKPTNLATKQDVLDLANATQNTVSSKMNATNPVGTGSFSMNRKKDSNIGINSHAEGEDTTASGTESHAEGSRTVASGADSHAEGNNTVASGNHAHSEGFMSKASGRYSHAEGYYTEATGESSHAEGFATIARGQYSHAEGMYNIEDTSNTYAHVVGNGTAADHSNAHTLDWDGNAWYQGDVYVGSTSGTNRDEGSKKLATEEFVMNEITKNYIQIITWEEND